MLGRLALALALLGLAVAGPAGAEEARRLVQVGNEVCTNEADYDRFWKESIDGTAAHKRGYRVPGSCFMIMMPAKVFVLERPTENKTKVRLMSGEHAGATGWTDAYLPRVP